MRNRSGICRTKSFIHKTQQKSEQANERITFHLSQYHEQHTTAEKCDQLEGRRSGLSYISIGVTLCAASYVLYNLLPGTAALAIGSMIVITFGEILSMPFMNAFWISRSQMHNRGQYAGLYTIAWATAQVLGPVLGSQLAEHVNFYWLWWVVGFVCLMAAAGFYYVKRLQRI